MFDYYIFMINNITTQQHLPSFSWSSFSWNYFFMQPSPRISSLKSLSHSTCPQTCNTSALRALLWLRSYRRLPEVNQLKLLWDFLYWKSSVLFSGKCFEVNAPVSGPAGPRVIGCCWAEWWEKQGFWMHAPTTKYNHSPTEATGEGFFTKMGMHSRQLWEPQRGCLLRRKSHLSTKDARLIR